MRQSQSPSFAIFDDYRPTVAIAVVVRWGLLAAWFFLNNYRVERDVFHLTLNLMGVGIAALNAYMTWRILARRPITWRHALALSLTDLAVITVGLFNRGGLSNDFYVFYYPAVLGFSLMFPRRATFTMVAIVMGLYTLMALTADPPLNLANEDEKKLIVRLTAMLGMAAAGSLITRWERTRRREAVAAERQSAAENLALQRKAQQAELAAVEERSRIAREIHDGIAQSIYMLSLSLEACVDLAGRESNGQPNRLKERLQALVGLSKQALLDTRYYIFDLKPVLDGHRLVTEMVNHQVQEFSAVTGIPAAFAVAGAERPLPVSATASLYRMVQEGLANIFKHAQATEAAVALEFGDSELRLTVTDNGRGFAWDAAQPRSFGYGLGNMLERARELGGSLEIDTAPGQGTKLRFAFPLPALAATAPV